MAKLKNFTLEGKAFNVTAYITPDVRAAHIAPDDRTAYTVELKPEFEKEGMTWEEFLKFRDAISADAGIWGDAVFDNVMLDNFEKSWKEDSERDTQQD